MRAHYIAVRKALIETAENLLAMKIFMAEQTAGAIGLMVKEVPDIRNKIAEF